MMKLEIPGQSHKFGVVLPKVFTPEECTRLILKSEERGYEIAMVNRDGVQTVDLETRNSYRCLHDDSVLETELFKRIEYALPKVWRGHRLLGVNPRMRYLRYDPGEYFKPHFDGSYQSGKQVSFLTAQLYLNESFGGGRTVFISGRAHEIYTPVIPETGSILLFEHHMFHEGETVDAGRKYTMRTDIMYSTSRHGMRKKLNV